VPTPGQEIMKGQSDWGTPSGAIVELPVDHYISERIRLSISSPGGLLRTIDSSTHTYHIRGPVSVTKAAQEGAKELDG
jgi:hypothetical protein